ncbi:prolyl oligopeptidase family serine peptidase [bacterium]|nr:prolyl oligopeptidase family serine peptidase [bacterium]
MKYPPTKRSDVIDNLHGVNIPDPYRWLEDIDSEETRNWIEAQNKLTFDFLNKIPARKKINSRLSELWAYDKYSPPFKRGNRYFYFKQQGLQNQVVLYKMDSLNDDPQVLIDPNTLSKDGTIALTGISINEDGSLIAYGLSSSGSDWQEWHVRDVESRRDLDDHLKWVKFNNSSWSKDGRGFYYCRYNEPKESESFKGANYYHKLYYHTIGTPQSEDKLVYERPDEKEWLFHAQVTRDSQFLIINVSSGTKRENNIFYKDISSNSEVIELLTGFEAEFMFISNYGSKFYFMTDFDAERSRVIAIDIERPERENWQEIIPECDDTLQDVRIVNHQMIAVYMHDAYNVVKVFSRDGEFIRNLELPGIGTVGGFAGRKDDTETFYLFTGFTMPSVIYRHDMKSTQTTKFRKPDVDFNPDGFITKQVFYHSKDGTRIPMFIVHKKDVNLDGSNPTYLYGYGGFGISLTPAFSVVNLVWLEMGGVLAIANLRGGGEYGKAWHEGGMKANRQNVFDDFIAAAEWLIENKYTNSDKLAIGGGSNGGLLVGACMTQRPGLFRACMPSVGVMDMLRFHRFTIGWAWTSDYGSPDDPDDFKTILAYSPLHNLKDGTKYPSVLIRTGDHDDRVFPAHSFKFAAALQRAQGGDLPTLIRIETKAGHGMGKPTSKIIQEAADAWAFLVETLGMDTV